MDRLQQLNVSLNKNEKHFMLEIIWEEVKNILGILE